MLLSTLALSVLSLASGVQIQKEGGGIMSVPFFFFFFTTFLSLLHSGDGALIHPFMLRNNSAQYYPSYSQDVSAIPFAGTNIAYYFVLVPLADGTIPVSTYDDSMMPGFVAAAHANGVKAVISLGGWEGSKYFSSAVSPVNHQNFATNVETLMAKYGFDGVSIDWEAPNTFGSGCNQYDPSDVANLLAFLVLLRANVPSMIITIAVGLQPYQSDMSGFASVLSFIK